jgi:hypothetical protein
MRKIAPSEVAVPRILQRYTYMSERVPFFCHAGADLLEADYKTVTVKIKNNHLEPHP